jgi:hypothetical protein
MALLLTMEFMLETVFQIPEVVEAEDQVIQMVTLITLAVLVAHQQAMVDQEW